MKKIFCNAIKAAVFTAALVGSAQGAIIEKAANIASDERWTRDNVYVITKIIYVLPPAKLTIEPGTVIRAAKATTTGFSNSPGSLIVTRGAKVIGNGTVDDPIVFTCLDDPRVPGGVNTIPTNVTGNSGVVTVTAQDFTTTGASGTNAFAYSKECGGLVILGQSPIGYDRDGDTNFLTWDGTAHSAVTAAGASATETIAYPTVFTTFATGNGTGFALIEGLTSTTTELATAFDSDGSGTVFSPSTTFNLGFFGGINENDNSGIYRFWSHRYGGFNVATANEINGVTMGGVGRGTILEFQEVAQNADDGFEWFGGYNNCRYLASVVNGDDCFDGDFGFSGNLQFLFAINDNEGYTRSGFSLDTDGVDVGRNSFAQSDKMIEWDGAETDNSRVTPQTNAWAYNFTFIGNKGATFLAPNAQDSAMHILKGADGNWNNGVAEDIHGPVVFIANATTTPVETKADVFNLLYNNIGSVSSGAGSFNDLTTLAAASIPQIRGKGHLTKNGLDPRLINDTLVTSIARDLTMNVPATRASSTNFFTPVRHRGAMRDNNWLFGWSWTHAVDLLATTNLDRPQVALTVASTTVSASFTADIDETTGTDKVVYVLERSSDGGVNWVPVGTVQDGSAADVPNGVLADSNATSGMITVADAAYVYTGAPVHYRVIGQ